MQLKSTNNYICVTCRGILKSKSRGLYCPSCEKIYPIIDGIVNFFSFEDENKNKQYKIFDLMSKDTLKVFVDPVRPMICSLMNKKTIQRAGISANMRVLILGCCNEGLLQRLSRDYGVSGHALDISLISLRLQNTVDPYENLYDLADCEYLPYLDNSFDRIYSFDVFEHVSNLERALKEAHRVLKPEGKLIIHMVVKDNKFSLDWLQFKLFKENWVRKMEDIGHFYSNMNTKSEILRLCRKSNFKIDFYSPYNVLFQNFYDHILSPKLFSIFYSLRSNKNKSPKIETKNKHYVSAVSSKSKFYLIYSNYILPILDSINIIDKLLFKLNFGATIYLIISKTK